MVRPVLPPQSRAAITGGTDMIRNTPRGATVYGIDLGKNIFHVVGTDPAGNIVQRLKFGVTLCLSFLRAPTQRWSAWKPAQARNGWRESCRRSDIASGSSQPNSSSLT